MQRSLNNLALVSLLATQWTALAQDEDDSPIIGAEDLGIEFDLTDNPVEEGDE